MDDYIYDLHTKGGKRSGNCMENFALEGAYIENENIEFLRPEYREIYVKLKQELDLYRMQRREVAMNPRDKRYLTEHKINTPQSGKDWAED